MTDSYPFRESQQLISKQPRKLSWKCLNDKRETACLGGQGKGGSSFQADGPVWKKPQRWEQDEQRSL